MKHIRGEKEFSLFSLSHHTFGNPALERARKSSAPRAMGCINSKAKLDGGGDTTPSVPVEFVAVRTPFPPFVGATLHDDGGRRALIELVRQTAERRQRLRTVGGIACVQLPRPAAESIRAGSISPLASVYMRPIRIISNSVFLSHAAARLLPHPRTSTSTSTLIHTSYYSSLGACSHPQQRPCPRRTKSC